MRVRFLGSAFFAILLTVAATTAQRTWIVDATGGGNFTDIPPAIAAAAPSGDLILVRSGTYSPAFIQGKGLRLVGLAGATIVSRTPRGGVGLSISGTSASQPVVVSGFGITVSNPLAIGVIVSGCGGTVHVERIDTSSILINSTRQATLYEVRATTAKITGTNLSMAQSTISGGSIDLIQTRATLINTSVTGPNVPFPFTPITLTGGQLTVTGDPTTRIAVPPQGGVGPAIRINSGLAIIDPSVILVPKGAPPVAGNSVIQPVASVRASVSSNALTTQLRATGALRGHTLLSLPIFSTVLPPVFGSDLWISPTHIVLDTGTMPTNGVRTTTTPLPTRPAGIQVTIQALIARPNALELSAPISLSLD